MSSWTWSTNVAEVDFTGLGAYNELLFIARGVTASVSGVRVLYASTDNGSTFYTTSGNYVNLDNTGVEANTTGFGHSTSSTAARSLHVHIRNTKGAVKSAYVQNTVSATSLFIASTSDIDAIRFSNTGGGNLTAGSAYLFGR